jgi:hypothetical protein
MPYIKSERRTAVLIAAEPDVMSAGELNFIFSAFINKYVEQHNLSYQTINDVIGALEGAKLEFYRRVAVPYEDKKLQENGDVYKSSS